MRRILLTSAVAVLTATAAMAQRDFLPPTMGWSSWNTYGANISEQIIRNQAKAMVDKGFAAAGYEYVNIDDGYFANRDASGRLIIHPTRFPNGMRPVVDYIHSLGLKAGCYSDAGHNTCASRWGGEKGGEGAGLYEHDAQDCEMYFNEYDFDFIKVDFCGGVDYHNVEGLNLDPRERYTAIRKAIDATGKPGVVLNACRWAYPGTWISDVADSWRVTGDINASWESVSGIIEESLYLAPYCGGGHYNDMDMLEVGRGLTNAEDVTHFGMWCIMSSPLLIGCDMTRVSQTALDLMTNAELIAINQDPLGLQAYVAKKTDDGVYILVKDIETRYGLRRAVALYNPTGNRIEVTLDFADVDLAGDIKVRDLVKHEDVAVDGVSLSVRLTKHASKFYIVEGTERLIRTKYEAEEAYLPEYQELQNNSWAETAIYDKKDFCSGGMAAGWLGKRASNNLQWRNVYVDTPGEYDLTVYYVCGENRNTDLYVNDERVGRAACNSGAWDRVGSFTKRITLNAGENVIKLANSSAWMPDIDYMTIQFVGSGIADIATDPGATDPRVIDLNGRVVSTDGDTTDLPSGIYIHQGRKIAK